MYVQERPLERVLWNGSVLLFLNVLRACPEAFNFSGQLWCFLSWRGKQIPLAVLYPTLLPLEQAAHQVPVILGCFLAWVLCSGRGWICPFACCRACFNSGTAGERPGTPALSSWSECRVHLTGSGALTFSAACTALPLINPEKPLNETRCNLLAGQTTTMSFGAPRQEGFCWSRKYPQEATLQSVVGVPKKRNALRCEELSDQRQAEGVTVGPQTIPTCQPRCWCPHELQELPLCPFPGSLLPFPSAPFPKDGRVLHAPARAPFCSLRCKICSPYTEMTAPCCSSGCSLGRMRRPGSGWAAG